MFVYLYVQYVCKYAWSQKNEIFFHPPANRNSLFIFLKQNIWKKDYHRFAMARIVNSQGQFDHE